MTVTTAEVHGKGQITIPKSVRDHNGLTEGTKVTVIDLGDGRLLLEPVEGDVIRQINRSFNRTSQLLKQKGVTLESALQAIRQMRENGE